MRKLNITFCSFPDFSGNAKALYNYMKNKYKDSMNYTWIVTSDTFKEKLNHEGINAIALGTSDFRKYIGKTDVFFTTHCNLTGDKSDRAIYIELWHGISPKKVGFMMNNISNADISWYEHLSRTVDYFIVPSEFWTTIFSARFNVDLKQVLPLGYPKLDFIKNKNAFKNLSELTNRDLSIYKKIIFYMPTFRKGCGRDDSKENVNNILNLHPYNEEQLVSFLEKNNYLLCVKKHPSEETQFPSSIKSNNIIFIDNSKVQTLYFDVYNILDAADLLITDYSSLGIEFLYLNKPCIYLNTDVDSYNISRGICYNNYNFWLTDGLNTIDNLLNKINEYLYCNSKIPLELEEKRKLWFGNLKNGGCDNICSYFFTDDGKLKVKPYINSNRQVVNLNKKIAKLDEEKKYYERLSKQRKEELDLVYNSRSWQVLERLRKIKNHKR